ncbi:carbohydrate ABC transporter permease [Cellulomonas sp. KRMCY2]|uniref:carbohydrate ABC transporter permease n=1 Tax=Cellulomonas sp. KRMCY2 TaxID=1304865 RepID=UPI00045EA687|nr:sugar ABC transporter permease [Cellulomonas sp. KRMCY2]
MTTAVATPRATIGSSDASRKRRRRTSLRAWLYAAPATAVLILLFVIPLGLAVWMSLHDWPLLGDAPTLNFPANYAEIPDERLFTAAVGFTVKYTAIIAVVLLTLSLGLALLIQESKRRGTGVLRTVFFLPVVTGLTTAALLFLGLLSPSAGPVDDILAWFGISVDFLGDPTWALISTVVMMTWRFAGFYMIILLAGLQAIPTELYEAAAIDGANKWRALRSVTIPLLRSTLALCTVLIVTGGLVAFEQFYVLTRGGPDNSTVTMVMTIFRQAFSQFNLGMAAAMSVVVLLGLVLLNMLQLRLMRDKDEVA